MLAFYLSMIEDPEESTKFEQIYLRYRDQMLRIALKILKNHHHDAEDAVHDAFLKLTAHVQELPEYDSKSTERYVYKMARNAAIDIFRKRYGDHAVLSLEDLFDYPDDTDIPQEYADNETYLKILDLLETMPIQYRDVLTLYWLDRKKPSQIADILNRPLATVNKQLHRGNKLFHEKLALEVIVP